MIAKSHTQKIRTHRLSTAQRQPQKVGQRLATHIGSLKGDGGIYEDSGVREGMKASNRYTNTDK